MTIIEAQNILNEIEKLPMFDRQKDQLTSILKKISRIINDLDAASAKQVKKKSRRTSVPSSSEFQISPAFENHLEQLKVWSRLDSAEQWTKQVAHDIHIEEERADEYIDICITQAGGFVEGLRQNVCDIIADVTLDGESKQWITTVVGLIIDSVLLILYALFAFDVGPFSSSQINDAVAGFIAAVVSVVTVVVTLIVCALVNRYRIRKYDEEHEIKYSELVRASKERGSFKKSMMLMSFGGDFEEIKQRDSKIYQNTNELLKYSITSESFQNAVSQKLNEFERRAEIANALLQKSLQNEQALEKKLQATHEQATKERQQSLANERDLKGQVTALTNELQVAHKEASKERQQFHREISEQAQSHQRELESANITINEQAKRIGDLNEKITNLNKEIADLKTASDTIRGTVTQLPEVIHDATKDLSSPNSWVCKVCCEENDLDVNSCKVCGASRQIADNAIETARKRYEPTLDRSGYYSRTAFVCIPKDYAGQCLRFEDTIKLRNKIIFVPKEIASIDIQHLLPNIDQRLIKVRVESPTTHLVNFERYTVEGKNDK